MQQPVSYHHDPKRVRDRPHPPRAPKRERREARQHNHGQHESREPNAKRERGQGQEGKPRAHGADHRVIDGKEVRQRLVHHVNAERDAQGHPGGAEMDHAVPHRTAVATITRCAVNATKAPPTRWKPSALAAPYAPSLRLEKLRHVLALAERRRMARRPAMLEIRLVIRRPNYAAYHAHQPGQERQGRIPHSASRIPFSLPSHIPSPHTAPRARRPSCDATKQATIPGATSRSRP